MAVKKKAVKKVKAKQAVKPFAAGEVIGFSCGGSVMVEGWGSGGVVVVIKPYRWGDEAMKLCIGKRALEALPTLAKRGLVNVARARAEDRAAQRRDR